MDNGGTDTIDGEYTSRSMRPLVINAFNQQFHPFFTDLVIGDAIS